MANYRKISELEKPVLSDVLLRPMLEDISRTYPELTWKVNVSSDIIVYADAGMLRQVLINLVKNAVEAEAQEMVIEVIDDKGVSHDQQLTLYVGNNGLPIPAENRQSLFVPFFTTKRSGSGIGLSLSRRMMVQQGGMLDLAEKQYEACRAGFVLTIPSAKALVPLHQ